QDAHLRQQVAEYLAIGRAMRGDMQVPGVDRLRERVAGELGETFAADDAGEFAPEGRKYVRPMIGFAVAATVALVAIFGLRQIAFDTADQGPGIADRDPQTIPDVDDLTDDLRRRHEAEEAIRTRFAEYPAIEELIEIPSPADAIDDEDNDDGDEQSGEPATDESRAE
ncbi:MAG: hypothetical protein ACE5F8_02940, partial [Woeseiaceae bacterium]